MPQELKDRLLPGTCGGCATVHSLVEPRTGTLGLRAPPGSAMLGAQPAFLCQQEGWSRRTALPVTEESQFPKDLMSAFLQKGGRGGALRPIPTTVKHLRRKCAFPGETRGRDGGWRHHRAEDRAGTPSFRPLSSPAPTLALHFP